MLLKDPQVLMVDFLEQAVSKDNPGPTSSFQAERKYSKQMRLLHGERLSQEQEQHSKPDSFKGSEQWICASAMCSMDQNTAFSLESLHAKLCKYTYWSGALKMLHGPTANKSTDALCGAHACHWPTFVVLALLEESNLEQRVGVPQGHAGRLESAMVWMWMLLAMQETISGLYSYPWSDDTAGLWAWPCRGFKSQCAQEPGL